MIRIVGDIVTHRKPHAKQTKTGYNWEWVCQQCGERGIEFGLKSAVKARKEHYATKHSKKEDLPSTPGECGESCANWNGKKNCMVGNLSRGGIILSCWRTE